MGWAKLHEKLVIRRELRHSERNPLEIPRNDQFFLDSPGFHTCWTFKWSQVILSDGRLATSLLCGAEIQIDATSSTTSTTSPVGL